MTFTPADPDALNGIRKAIQDTMLHEHHREDWFCMNLHLWLGERSGWLVARLDEAYAEIERLHGWAKQRTALIEVHAWDETIFGGFYCMTCSNMDDDSTDLVTWPCSSLRAVGVTDAEAVEIIQARRTAIQAKAAGHAGA